MGPVVLLLVEQLREPVEGLGQVGPSLVDVGGEVPAVGAAGPDVAQPAADAGDGGVPALRCGKAIEAWRTRDLDFPEQRWTVGGRPAWSWTDVEAWARATGRIT